MKLGAIMTDVKVCMIDILASNLKFVYLYKLVFKI